jgi:hypothetical protein
MGPCEPSRPLTTDAFISDVNYGVTIYLRVEDYHSAWFLLVIGHVITSRIVAAVTCCRVKVMQNSIALLVYSHDA